MGLFLKVLFLVQSPEQPLGVMKNFTSHHTWGLWAVSEPRQPDTGQRTRILPLNWGLRSLIQKASTILGHQTDLAIATCTMRSSG